MALSRESQVTLCSTPLALVPRFVTALTDIMTTVTTPVQLSVQIADADDDRCTLFVSYSFDQMTWTQGAPTGPTNVTVISGGTSALYGASALVGDGVVGAIEVNGFTLLCGHADRAALVWQWRAAHST